MTLADGELLCVSPRGPPIITTPKTPFTIGMKRVSLRPAEDVTIVSTNLL